MRLTVKQAADRAGVSRGLIYLWVGERRLPVFRLGGKGRRGKILIEDVDLDGFLASLRVGADEPPSALSSPPLAATVRPPRLRHVRVKP